MPYVMCWNASGLIGPVIVANDIYGKVRIPVGVFEEEEEVINRLTPNDPYMGRTAPLTSKRYILYIYSTNIGTEYFKYAL